MMQAQLHEQGGIRTIVVGATGFKGFAEAGQTLGEGKPPAEAPSPGPQIITRHHRVVPHQQKAAGERRMVPCLAFDCREPADLFIAL